MSESRYDLVINGTPNGADAEDLKQHVSTVCKLAPAVVDIAIGELMAGLRKTVVLRKHLPQAVAQQLKVSLETRGLVCTLVAPLGLVALEISVEKKEYVCPACDHRQPYTDAQDDAPCANCGVIRSKYLKNEQTRKAIERERRLRQIKKQNEVEQQLRDEDQRDKEKIEATVRKQLGRERRVDSINRVVGLLRATSVPARMATAILLIGALPLAYLVRANYAESDDAKVTSGHSPEGGSIVLNGTVNRNTSGAPASSASRSNDSGGGGPETVSLGAGSGVDSEVAIHISSGGGTEDTSSKVGARSDADEGVPAGSLGAEGASREHLDTSRSTVATASPRNAGGGPGAKPDALSLSAGTASTGTPERPGSGSEPKTVLSGGPVGIASSEGESGWRGTMQHALSVAKGIEDASERSKSLGVLASVYTEMTDTRAAENALAEAMESATSSDIMLDYAGALGKIAKARCELWAVTVLSQRNERGSVPLGVTKAIETARTISGARDRVDGLSNIAKYLALAGQAYQAEMLFKEAFNAAGGMANVGESMSARGDIAQDLVDAGDVESAQALADRMWEDALRIVDVHERVEALGAVAVTVSAWEGGVIRAEELLAEVQRLGGAIVDSAERARVTEAMTLKRVQILSLRAGVLAAAGKENDARSALEHAMGLVDKIAAPGDRIVALGSIVKGQGSQPVRRSTTRLLTVDLRMDEAAPGKHASGTSSAYPAGSRFKEETPLAKK